MGKPLKKRSKLHQSNDNVTSQKIAQILRKAVRLWEETKRKNIERILHRRTSLHVEINRFWSALASNFTPDYATRLSQRISSRSWCDEASQGRIPNESFHFYASDVADAIMTGRCHIAHHIDISLSCNFSSFCYYFLHNRQQQPKSNDTKKSTKVGKAFEACWETLTWRLLLTHFVR